MKLRNRLLVGVEDVLGVACLGLAGAVWVQALWPSPETHDLSPWIATLIGAVFMVAALLLFAAAHHLHRTRAIAPRLHLAAWLSALLIPILGVVVKSPV
jgi:hypothetical protein